MSFISIETIQSVCKTNNIPFVSFRKPNSTEITTYIQFENYPAKIKLDELSGIDSGFIIAPFNNVQSSCYVIKPDIKIVGNIVDDRLLSYLNSVCFQSNDVYVLPNSTTETDFCTSVENAKTFFAGSGLAKVVLSRVELIEKPVGFSSEDLFSQLCDIYAHAYLHYAFLPGIGSWLGASPEPLLVCANGVFSTVSLAGTQLADERNVTEYNWGLKELEEQAIVTRFVKQTLLDIDVRNLTELARANIQAGKLIHLCTPFTFELNSNVEWPALLNSLHPTPSVAGMPRNLAVNFINSYEKHNREFYSGLIGNIQNQQTFHLYVNLRCMQVFDTHIAFYSGAGITPDSDAKSEWAETTNKLTTMKKLVCAGCV